MKLARVGTPGAEQPVVVTDEGALLNLRGITDHITPAFLGDDGGARPRLDVHELPDLGPLGGQRYGARITRPHKVLCLGLNHTVHAEESGMAVPTEPGLFARMTNTVVRSDDTVLVPRGSENTASTLRPRPPDRS